MDSNQIEKRSHKNIVYKNYNGHNLRCCFAMCIVCFIGVWSNKYALVPERAWNHIGPYFNHYYRSC